MSESKTEKFMYWFAGIIVLMVVTQAGFTIANAKQIGKIDQIEETVRDINDILLSQKRYIIESDKLLMKAIRLMHSDESDKLNIILEDLEKEQKYYKYNINTRGQ